MIGRQGLNHITLVYRRNVVVVTQCGCIVPAHYQFQSHSVDQSQEPVAHPYLTGQKSTVMLWMRKLEPDVKENSGNGETIFAW